MHQIHVQNLYGTRVIILHANGCSTWHQCLKCMLSMGLSYKWQAMHLLVDEGAGHEPCH